MSESSLDRELVALAKKHPLRKDFTNYTMRNALRAKRREHARHQKRSWSMKRTMHYFKTVPGIAILLLVLSVGSVGAYTATLGPVADNPGTTVVISPEDPTIVTVDLKDCQLMLGSNFRNPEVKEQLRQGPVKFKLLQPDKFTAEQVRASVLAACDSDDAMKFYREQHKDWFPGDRSTNYAPYFNAKIVAIDAKQVTVDFAWRGLERTTITYPIQPGLIIYRNGAEVPFGSLQPGDFAMLIIHQPADLNSPNYWPEVPTAENSSLVSITELQYDDSKTVNLYDATRPQYFEPLDSYLKRTEQQ